MRYSALSLDNTDDQVALDVSTLGGASGSVAAVLPMYAVVTNPDAATVYVKFYDGATWDVSAVAPTLDFAVASGASVTIPLDGVRFTTGLCMASTASAGTGGAAPGANTLGMLVYRSGG